MEQESTYVTMSEAAEILGLDRRQIRRLIVREKIKTRENPVDARQRLLLRSDLEQLKPFAAKKAAA